MDNDQQLAWEAKKAPLAAASAIASVLLLLGAQIYTIAALDTRPDNANNVDLMRSVDAQPGVFVTSRVIGAVATLAAIYALVYLFQVVRARRSELAAWTLPLIVLGSILIAVGSIVNVVELVGKPSEFFDSGARTNERARDILLDQSPVSQGVNFGGVLSFAIALVMLSVAAMRSGVLSRLMGFVGVAIGVLSALQAIVGLGPGIVQLFWLAALAVIFLNRWPGGRGPAWEVVESRPWPTSVERREAMLAKKGGGSVVAQQPEAVEPDDATSGASRPKKRKHRS